MQENGVPVALLDIKCPFKGAKLPISESIELEFKSCLETVKGILVRPL